MTVYSLKRPCRRFLYKMHNLLLHIWLICQTGLSVNAQKPWDPCFMYLGWWRLYLRFSCWKLFSPNSDFKNRPMTAVNCELGCVYVFCFKLCLWNVVDRCARNKFHPFIYCVWIYWFSHGIVYTRGTLPKWCASVQTPAPSLGERTLFAGDFQRYG